jgi:nitroimidazol reductase NimA-like FMN-containing flavoprotein (pyridoxamine 5'-phosphate oxidase superfamily)
MDILHARSGLEVIPRKECLALLAGQKVGRLGFVVDGQPMVMPVNYALHGDVVVFRTGEGSILGAAHSAKVAFEVDEVDEVDAGAGSGWSVVVQGVAEEIPGTGDWFDEALRAQAAPTWVPGPTDHYVRIKPSVISGRRLRAGPPAPCPDAKTRGGQPPPRSFRWAIATRPGSTPP